MDNRLFVLVLQETESDEWTSGHSLSGILWNVFEMHSNPSPSLAEGTERQLASMNLRKKKSTDRYRVGFGFGSSTNRSLRPLEILKLEYSCIISRQVLVGIPRARAE